MQTSAVQHAEAILTQPSAELAARPARLSSWPARPDIPNPAMEAVAQDDTMQKKTGQKKQKCKNCEGKGTLAKGDKVVRCQRCDGTGIKR
jgi:hypothetical protein